MSTFKLIASVAAVSLLGVTMAAGAVAPAHAETPKTVQYIVMPHEDDEFEAWSQIENNPNTYKVFITMGRGEQTAYCSGYSSGFQPGLEKAPVPIPGPQFSKDCSLARISSQRAFLTQMSQTDLTIPGDWTTGAVTQQFPSNGVQICRADDPTGAPQTSCTLTDRSAEVWKDAQGRGEQIIFNLGESDQTPTEIDWALDTVFANKAALGIDPALDSWGMLGGFSNTGYGGCFVYPHPDHRAVHVALWNNKYPVPFQMAATCSRDSDATVVTQVSEASMVAAWQVSATGVRVGAHVSNYGWLHETYYPLDKYGEMQIFHGKQAFWKRANAAPAPAPAPVPTTTCGN